MFQLALCQTMTKGPTLKTLIDVIVNIGRTPFFFIFRIIPVHGRLEI